MNTLFFSYSHKDEALRNELEVHLVMLKREGLIDTWHDRRIPAGDALDSLIDVKINSAKVILLLVSPDFLASNYCYDLEMKRAMERHALGECRVIPIILRPCDWHHAPFANLLAVPTDGRAVTKWPNLDEAFLDVVTQIRATLPDEAIHQTRVHSPVVSPSRNAFGPRSSNLRLRKEFTEIDRDRFQDEAFSFIKLFFEGSLKELEQRYSTIQTRFISIDARSFGAVIYQHGNAVAQCGIRNGGRRGFDNGITFSFDEKAPDNTHSESLSVEEGEQSLFLKPMMGMHLGFGREVKEHLTHEGAAEHFWSLLIEPLQR